MPTPYEKTVETDQYRATIKVSSAGIPIVSFARKDETALPQVEITYIPTHVRARPILRIHDADYLTTDNARRVAAELIAAARIADMAHEEISRTFLLPKANPGGDSEDRTAAIVNLITQGLPITHENIDKAIASCYQTEQESGTMYALRAINNVFANNEHVQDMIVQAICDAAEYRTARDHEQELAHAPADEYDPVGHHAADMHRTSAHNAFIRSMVALSTLAVQTGMENAIARIASMSDPFSPTCREQIAQMAYEMA